LEQIHVIDEAFEILDSDNDCNIDVVDLLALLGEFGCSEDPLDVTSECSMDADDNGEVDTTDVLLFLGLFGSTCDTMFPGGPDAQNPNESSAAAQ
jgi:Ca2+-binding EF-hand superfamily protein